VVLAAGHSERFGAFKQYALLGGQRLVDRAVSFVRSFADDVIVVLPKGHRWDGSPVRETMAGGPSRTDSLRNAVAALSESAEFVLVHDVVRPLATERVVRDLLDAVAAGADGAVPIWSLADTLKTLHPDGRVTHAGRDEVVVAQSPTAFRIATLERMFSELDEIPIEETVGVERIGGRVVGVPGDRWSHHVVEPRDLMLMERLIDVIEDNRSGDPK